MLFIDYHDSISDLGGPPLTPERRAAMKRCFDKVAAWCVANPDKVPRLPHYRHTCLNPDTCTLDHDPVPRTRPPSSR